MAIQRQNANEFALIANAKIARKIGTRNYEEKKKQTAKRNTLQFDIGCMAERNPEDFEPHLDFESNCTNYNRNSKAQHTIVLRASHYT